MEMENEIYDTIIVGGASAGLVAGIYLARKKAKVAIVTKKVGGQSLMTDTIENFPGFESISGFELIEKIRKQAKLFGTQIKENRFAKKITKNNDNIFEVQVSRNGEDETMFAKTVIIATGKNPRHLGVPGEKEFENKGVSFCTTCDAPLYQGKTVAVIGGGNSGLSSAYDLTKYADKIYLLERSDAGKGDVVVREKLMNDGKVEFLTNVEVKEIKGEKFLEKIIYLDKKIGEEKELAVGGMFINIGWIPATKFLEGFVKLNEYGEVIVNSKTMETSVSGVFSAGDVNDGLYKQCIIAAGEGAVAALSAYDYMMR